MTHQRFSAGLISVVVTLLLGCGNSGGSSPSGPSSHSGPSGANVLTITINPSSAVCTNGNDPCTQVTICQAGTSTCQTISDILVDTGSSGLRVFASALTLTLPASNIGECMFFGGGTDWGSVHTVDVMLGNEPAVSVPIQVVDPTFAGQYTSAGAPASNICNVASVDASPSQVGHNGILGVGVFQFDGGVYYNCVPLPCMAISPSTSQQVQNPVGLLPVDNNGVIVAMPSVPASGLPSLTGSLILGIGTASNNQPSGVTVLPTDSSGRIVTQFTPDPSISFGIIDSGSNVLFFNDLSLLNQNQLCPSPYSFLYCPSPSPLNLTAVNMGASGAHSSLVNFEIADPRPALNAGNFVINNVGGPAIFSGTFDWGLPFFFGRTVFVGLEGKTSVLGTGPFFAY
jgi:uncharacterized protein DUF3443